MKLRLVLIPLLAVAGLVAMPTTAQAAANSSISGTVTESTVPAANAFVGVIAIVDHGIFGKGPGLIADTFTDANGHYTVSGLPPSNGRGYWVCTVASDWPFGPYDGQCYDQADGFAPFPSGAGFVAPSWGAKTIPLLGGQHRIGIDADLHKFSWTPSGITGKVTALGLLPIRHATVTVDQNGVRVDATFSAASGTYRITGLAPGSYHVCFDGSTAGNYSSKCRRALVQVNADAVTKGINGVLTTSG